MEMFNILRASGGSLAYCDTLNPEKSNKKSHPIRINLPSVSGGINPVLSRILDVGHFLLHPNSSYRNHF